MGTRVPASSNPSQTGRVASKIASFVKLPMAKLSIQWMGQRYRPPEESIRDMESLRAYMHPLQLTCLLPSRRLLFCLWHGLRIRRLVGLDAEALEVKVALGKVLAKIFEQQDAGLYAAFAAGRKP